MMQHRHRRRRRQFSDTTQNKTGAARLVASGLLLLLLFVGVKKTFEFFGVGNAKRSTAAVLTIEPGGVVNVSVEGGPMKRAETDIKLYAGDSVVTSPRNNAILTFFDGSAVRLDESTQLNINESYEGEETSKMEAELAEGTLWVATPKLATYSGAITRTVKSAYLSAVIPSQPEVVLSPRSIAVFSADGLGLTVTVAGSDQTVVVGEGQQFTLPPGGEQEADLYVYRNPLNSQQILSPFVEESRNRYAQTSPSLNGIITSSEPTSEDDGVILEVEAPEDGSTIDTSTVEVRGRIGKDVERVRINGYLANVNLDARTFNEELALPEEDAVNITIEAIDEDGVVIAEALRTVTRNRKPPEAPVILSPAGAGETYVTNRSELEISGTAPEGAVGIIVNDYRLQLFEPGDTEWSYLANTQYNNMQMGENVYEVVAINRGGYRSEPAILTIILDESAVPGVVPEEGVEEGSSSEGGVRPTPPVTVEESSLPNNTPLMPGTISITAPGGGEEFTTSNVENLIEGTVPAETDSVWVNGYRLRLYEPGKTFFNYIASVELNTLKRGRNPYRITARSEDGYVLDEMTYVLHFRP